jgi:hypothetical protein
MSRIGKKVINIPAKTKVEIKENIITATGALGTLSYTVPAGITPEMKDGALSFSIPENRVKELNALHGFKDHVWNFHPLESSTVIMRILSTALCGMSDVAETSVSMSMKNTR